MVRFAVIGTSRITEKFLRSAENCPDFSLEAVYSRTLERGRTFAQKYGARRVYDSLAGLAEDPQVDAVYIASPNASHCSQAMQMMEAGKHVLCEKALASNLPQAGDMFACAREHGVVLMEAMRSIHDPGFQKIRENLPKLGKIRRADFRFCQYSSRYDDFRAGKPQNIFDVNCSAGALMDIGVYCVHPLLGLFGTPDRILAAPVMLRGGIDGAGTILAEYEDKIAELVYSKITSTALPSEIQGEKGVMIISSITNPGDVVIQYNDGSREKIQDEMYENNMQFEAEDFIRRVQGQAGPGDYEEISLGAMELMDEARRQCGIHFPADSR